MRRTLTRIHLWLGLIIGLLWAVSGLSGAMLVFAKEIDRFAGSHGTVGAPASLDEVMSNARQAANGAFIERLLVKDRHGELINALYADQHGEMRVVVVDAATAEALKVIEWEPMSPFSGSLYRWLYMFHMTYLTGHNGMTLVGITGLFLVSASILGLWIAWPRGGSWKYVFDFRRWRKTEHRLYGWHRAVGLMVGFILIGTALTGVYMALPTEPVRNFVASFAEYRPTHAAKRSHHQMPMQSTPAAVSPQQALEIVQRMYPGAPWVRFWPPTEHYPLYTIRVRQPNEIRAWLGMTTVAVDASSGEVVGTYDALEAPPANKLFDGMYSFHNGEIAGLGGRFIAVLVGLMLPTLYVTGVWSWWRKRKQKAVRRP